jgi:hypothetical protein
LLLCQRRRNDGLITSRPGIPEIRDSQFSGLRLSAEVRVQSFSDYSLRVKFEKSRFLTVNGEVSLSQRGRLTKSSETEQAIQVSILQ